MSTALLMYGLMALAAVAVALLDWYQRRKDGRSGHL
jgi:hypothetical protein